MSIQTVKPDKQLYLRIVPKWDKSNEFLRDNCNRVAKVDAITVEGSDGPDLIFFQLDGGAFCVGRKDVEFITEREYFKGRLSG